MPHLICKVYLWVRTWHTWNAHLRVCNQSKQHRAYLESSVPTSREAECTESYWMLCSSVFLSNVE